MRESANELERTYRRMYYRIIVGVWLTCAILSFAILFAVSSLPVASAMVRQMGWGTTEVQRSPAASRPIGAVPSCRLKSSWSTVRNASIARNFREYHRPYASASLTSVSTHAKVSVAVLSVSLLTSS